MVYPLANNQEQQPGHNSTSSSSRFTEEEILEGLLEQGVVPSNKLISQLKRELDEIMTVEEQGCSALSHGLSEGRRSKLSDQVSLVSDDGEAGVDVGRRKDEEEMMLRALHNADRIHARVNLITPTEPPGISQPTRVVGPTVETRYVWTPSDIENLLAEAENWSDTLKAETERIHQMELKWSQQPLFPKRALRFAVSPIDQSPVDASSSVEQRKEESKTVMSINEARALAKRNGQRQALNELSEALRTELKLSKLDDVEIPVEEYENYLKEAEKFQSRTTPSNAVRAVVCPEPGLAPFKHDPVKSYELYRKYWQKHPIPGEDKRLQLRWKVREYMLRHDVVTLKN